MKKTVLILLALVMVFSVSAFAAKKMMMVEVDDGTPAVAPATPEVILNNCFSTNIYPWFVVWMNISYERMFGPIVSLKVSASNAGTLNTVGGSLLFHPMSKGLDGFYVGPKYDAWLWGDLGTINWLGGIAGYNFLIQNVALFSLGVGVQFNVAGPIFTLGNINFGDKWPIVETSIGWAF